MTMHDFNRREVLKALAGMTAALMAPAMPRAFGADAPATQPTEMRDRWGELLPQRRLGARGPMVTMLGLGGAHIGQMQEDATAQRTIETAIAGGIRYFDTASSYRNSEARYGMFLTPKYRSEIFITSKTITTSGEQAQFQLDQSLSRMKTDYLDLWHMHSLHSTEDVDLRLSQGVLDVMLNAKEKGKVRHLGFSGHVIPDSHLHMLERTKDKPSAITACQMPVNIADPSYRSFVLNVIPNALEAGVGILAMKTLANGGFFGGAGGKPGAKIIPDRVSIADALHFVWSLPISVLVSGADNPEMIQEKIDLARNFTAMAEPRRNELVAKVSDLAGVLAEPHKSEERLNRGNRGNRGIRGAAAPAPPA